jgi:hypothetical protein
LIALVIVIFTETHPAAGAHKLLTERRRYFGRVT